MVYKLISNLSIFVSIIILMSFFFVFRETSFLRPSLPFSKVNNVDIHSPRYRIDLILLDRNGVEVFNDNFYNFKKTIFYSHSAKITFLYSTILMQFNPRSDLQEIIQRYICLNNTENIATINLKYSNGEFAKTVVLTCD